MPSAPACVAAHACPQVISFDDLVTQQENRDLGAEAEISFEGSSPGSDKGSCYDSEDSFLDDAELVEELEPSRMKSKIDGFFINTGNMEAELDPSYEGHTTGRARLTPHGTQVEMDGGKKKKRKAAGDGPGSMASPNIVGASPIAASSPVRAVEGLGGSSSKSGMSPRNRADVGRGGKPRAKKLKKNKQIVLPKIHDGILARLQDLREFMQSEEQRGRVNGGASPLWWPIF